MAQIKLCTLLLQIKLLLWKNLQLKRRRWKELVLMIAFAIFSMLLIGAFRSSIQPTMIPAYHPQPTAFALSPTASYGQVALMHNLDNTDLNTVKMQYLQLSLQQWFDAEQNHLTVITNITSEQQLDRIVSTQSNATFDFLAPPNLDSIKFAIVINAWNDDDYQFDYALRLPSAQVPSSSEPLLSNDQQISAQQMAESIGIGHSYSTQFIPLQLWMDRFFMSYVQSIANYSAAALTPLVGTNLKYQAFWSRQHEDDPFMDSMGSLLPFYIISCFLLPFSYMIKDVVEEKSQQIKEGMRTMGLHILSFWLSWLLTYLIIGTVVASLIIFIQWKTAMFAHTSFALLYVLYILYAFSVILFASVMTTFFDKAKTASTVSGFTYFLLQMPAYAIKSKLSTIGLSTKMLFSLFSPTAMFIALLSVIDLEKHGHGYTLDNLFSTDILPAVQNGYCVGYSLVMILVDIVIYLISTWFLDQYLRSEYGQKLTVKQILSQISCCPNRSTLKYAKSPSGSGDKILYKRLRRKTHSSSFAEYSNVPLSPNEIEMELSSANKNNNRRESVISDNDADGDDHEKEVAIQILNLFKTYGSNGANGKSVRAVNDLSMDIYKNECCALLGSNGAGKTTTINMLTGMIDISSGTANICGHSIKHEMAEIRQFLGVCPQHSLLWPMLTVYEHLYLFATLKNMNKDDIDSEIDALLHDVGLAEKKKSYSSTLSGGQKRKLSLAIAFIGDPKVIFLDEPSSGMDPVSRRYTWDLIEKYKENRCIILTTHDMNEADAVADRIAIMSHGRLRIYGSSLYLKSVCGVGYNLVFTIQCRKFDKEQIKQHLHKLTVSIQAYIENATLFNSQSVYTTIEKLGNKVGVVPSLEVVFKTAIQDSRKFPDLFGFVDSNLKQLHISNYAVSVTTLEEVFLRIAGDVDVYSAPKIQSADDRLFRDSGTGSNDIQLEEAVNEKPNNDRVTAAVTLNISEQSSKMEEKAKMASPMSKIEEYRVDQDIVDSLCKFQRPELSSLQLAGIHFTTIFKKRFNTARRDLRGIITQCVMPLLSLLFGLSLVRSFDTVNTAQPAFSLLTTPYQSPLLQPYNNISTNSTFTSIIQHYSDHVQPVAVNQIASISEFNHWILNETYKQSPYHIDPLYNALYSNISDNSVTFISETKATHLLPALVNEWNQAMLKQLVGPNKSAAASISVQSHPFPLTNSEVQMMDLGITMVMVILISLSYAFIPTSFAVHIVTERESRVKHQHIIAGLTVSMYWISNLIFDLLVFMVPCIMGGIIIAALQIQTLTARINPMGVLLVFLLFGFSVITLTYLLSFFFKNPQTAQTILGRMYEISGMLFLIIGIMISQFIPYGTFLWADVLLFVFRLFPNYAFGEALFKLASNQQQNSFLNLFVETDSHSTNLLSWEILGRDLCFMAVTTMTNLGLICAVEYVSFDTKLMRWFQKMFAPQKAVTSFAEQLHDHDDQDTDVIEEKHSIQNNEKRHVSSIEIRGLRKVFQSKKNNNTLKVAVNDLWYAIGQSEIFGFLGSNGAGKTTTMKMLTRETTPSSGTAYFRNGAHENSIVDSNYYEFFYQSHLGYCPQNDGLMELLTGREHLEIYCRIRGFSKPNTKLFVDTLIGALNLTEFANGAVSKYSGGNRRKVCVAIALIGNPSIVMLDEPSTGIDPISRRFMWNFIRSMTRNEIQKRSVLLTTHSMEEAESLCDRIGIMDKGNLQCLGTAQHLKTKYGHGYELFVKLQENFEEDLKEELKRYILGYVLEQLQKVVDAQGKLVSIKLIDEHHVIMRFSIRLSGSILGTMELEQKQENEEEEEEEEEKKQDVNEVEMMNDVQPKFEEIPLGKVFGFVESVKRKYQIVEYSISQNTLEQVFLNLVDEEEEDESNDATAKGCKLFC